MLTDLVIDENDLVVHGDCIGADADFDEICKARGIPRRVRPCAVYGQRAGCDGEEILDPKPPMERNRSIVADADIMIACPWNYKKVKRSGTWATIGFAERSDVETYVVFPDGRVV